MTKGRFLTEQDIDKYEQWIIEREHHRIKWGMGSENHFNWLMNNPNTLPEPIDLPDEKEPRIESSTYSDREKGYCDGYNQCLKDINLNLTNKK